MDSSPHLATEKSSDHNKKLSDLIEQFNSSAAGCSDRCHAEKQVPDFDKAVAFRNSVKARFGEQSETYEKFIRIMSGHQRSSIKSDSAIAAVKELLGGHPDLIRGFNTFLPRVEQREMVEKCTSFLNKLKGRFPSSESCTCSSFARILSMYGDQSMSIHQFCEEAAALFSAHPDVLKEIEEFLPDASRKPRCSGGDIALGAASPRVTIGAKTVRVDDPKHGRKRRHARNERIIREAASRRSTAPKRAVMESLKRLDTSNLERCTPSYCILPKNYRLPVGSYMSKLDKSVLNDTVVLASKRKRRR